MREGGIDAGKASGREEPAREGAHALSLENRARLALSGVRDVTGFHEQEVLLTTDSGELLITGEGLHIVRLLLEEGRLEMNGRVDSLSYRDVRAAKKQGALRRMLR